MEYERVFCFCDSSIDSASPELFTNNQQTSDRRNSDEVRLKDIGKILNNAETNKHE